MLAQADLGPTIQYEPLAPAPNTILAIYQNPESAQKLISVSPLQLRLERRDSSWKYLGSEDLTEVDKPTTDDQAPVIQEEEATASAEIAKSESKPSASNNASQTSTPIATKSNPSQLPNGTQKWGSRGPSVEKPLPPPPPHSPIPSDSTPKPPPSPSFPLFPLEPQKTDRYGRSISTRYREYKLEIRPSNMNHKAYIARQAYFGPFPPDRKTIMAAGLEGRVPLDGIVDCHVGKPEVPLRVRVKMKERGAFKRFSIRELFEKGVKEGRGD